MLGDGGWDVGPLDRIASVLWWQAERGEWRTHWLNVSLYPNGNKFENRPPDFPCSLAR
jgi:hypothetical protein